MNTDMKVYNLLFLMLFAFFYQVNAQEKYFTSVNNKLIKNLQVKVTGQKISNSYITLGSSEKIEIDFDGLGYGYTGYTYSIVHCNGDWTKSQLTPVEYLDGFQGLYIEDFANSIGTTSLYSNYRLFLPNKDVQFKVSGNYAVQVYKETDPSNIIFTACFSIVEPQISIAASIDGNTDIDTHQNHQQVNFNINTRNLSIAYPQTDLKIFVYQNNRRDNFVTNLQPLNIQANDISYYHNRNLIFPAGNEYRRMEFLSNKYNGMHVEHISYHRPYYNVELMTDQKRSNATYEYDQDQDGRFFSRCSRCSDPDTEGDYCIVHFALESNELPEGDIYLNGEFLNNELNEMSKMSYNPQAKRYEKSLLLKQGSYNYQYLFVPSGSSIGETAPIEGNYYQTENEYSIYVYYCPMGARYDRLIGVTSVKNEMPIN